MAFVFLNRYLDLSEVGYLNQLVYFQMNVLCHSFLFIRAVCLTFRRKRIRLLSWWDQNSPWNNPKVYLAGVAVNLRMISGSAPFRALYILGDPGAVSRAGRKGATKTRAWKLSLHLFSRPDWLPLGLRRWGLYGWYIILSYVLDLPVTMVLLILLFDLFL